MDGVFPRRESKGLMMWQVGKEGSGVRILPCIVGSIWFALKEMWLLLSVLAKPLQKHEGDPISVRVDFSSNFT